MPKATVSTEHETFQLRTCPGGYVTLRQLSYAEMMHRRDIMARLYYEETVKPTNRAARRAQKQSPDATRRAELEVLNVKMMEWEFSKCIVDHNLEDDDGNKLDFSNAMSFDVLDPKIGAEIDGYIEDMNQEDEDDVAPLESARTSSSLDGEIKPTPITE
jgi:hypothetical protein